MNRHSENYLIPVNKQVKKQVKKHSHSSAIFYIYPLLFSHKIKKAALSKWASNTAYMNWKNTGRDPLPADRQEVLISVEGVYYIAIYHAEKGIFSVAGELNSTVFHHSDNFIYWRDLPGDN